MTFADAVREAMNSRSMDAKSLVEKSGVNAPYISNHVQARSERVSEANAQG